ncbi:MAG: TraR/DksA C4-type zinc finger protein [Anaerolineae bacterium]
MAENNVQTHLEKLHEEREEVVLELSHLREALKIEVSSEVDEADPDLVEREKTVALVKSLERKLMSIDYAIRQAQNGSYGVCERCGQPIPPERLEIFPETTLCVSCKQMVEREMRRRVA